MSSSEDEASTDAAAPQADGVAAAADMGETRADGDDADDAADADADASDGDGAGDGDGDGDGDGGEDAGTKEEPLATLHVANLTRNVTAAHLSEIFGTYGEVAHIDLATDARVGLSKGFAHVDFKLRSDAETAQARRCPARFPRGIGDPWSYSGLIRDRGRVLLESPPTPV